MIDRYVAEALRNTEPGGGDVSAEVLLLRFQRLLKENEPHLIRLGDWLNRQLGDRLAGSFSPVRVLDSLLWIDWWACWEKSGYFIKWIVPEDEGRQEYELTCDGKNELGNLPSL